MTERQFWELVDVGPVDQCWPWMGTLNEKGYSNHIKIGNEPGARAHRIAYEKCFGPLGETNFGCHSCDNRGCCNPFHVFPGSIQDNHADMVAKGRQAAGEQNGGAKLTWDVVREMRAQAGATHLSLSKKYGISRAQVSNIMSGRRWVEEGG